MHCRKAKQHRLSLGGELVLRLVPSCGLALTADFFATRDLDRSSCPLATCAGLRRIVRHFPRISPLVTKKSAARRRGEMAQLLFLAAIYRDGESADRTQFFATVAKPVAKNTLTVGQ
jgi:hypothetical protein